MPKIKIRNNRRLPPLLLEEEKTTGPVGRNCEFLDESDWIPIYNKAGEEVIPGPNNSFIVQGRDRPANASTGIGGDGGNECGMIDLIVGLGGEAYKKHIDKTRAKMGALDSDGKLNNQEMRRRDPNFIYDAARIYMTEKGDIDKYMGLAQGTEMRKNSHLKSAIGIKADHVRIVGREHIKIITGKMRLDGATWVGEKNSKGGNLEFPGQIDLIAGNYTDGEKVGLLSFFGKLLGGKKKISKLQPVPKGQNLIVCLNSIMKQHKDMMDLISENKKLIQKLALAGQHHVHGGGPGGPTTPPLIWDYIKIVAQAMGRAHHYLRVRINIAIFEITYLMPLFNTYINSRHVNIT
jgi:hypothetical protein